MSRLSITRHTIASALRASLCDEKKRQEKASIENAAIKMDSSAGKTADRSHSSGTNGSARAPKPSSNPTQTVNASKAGPPKGSKVPPSKEEAECKDKKVITETGGAKKKDRGKAESEHGHEKDEWYSYEAAKPHEVPQNRLKNCDNLEFYQNKMHSKPLPGHTIEQMLKWKGDYRMLESNHRYIQWLFPIPEGSGMNIFAQKLEDEEAEIMRMDDSVQKRVLSAYKMMLDFYGMRLKDVNHGTVVRSENWKERFAHLNRSKHNLLRITRILKSIGELGFERFQGPWVEFLMNEATQTHALSALNSTCMNHWIAAVKDPHEQQVLYKRFQGHPRIILEERDTFDSESDEEENSRENNLDKAPMEEAIDEASVNNDSDETLRKPETIVGYADEHDRSNSMTDCDDRMKKIKVESDDDEFQENEQPQKSKSKPKRRGEPVIKESSPHSGEASVDHSAATKASTSDYHADQRDIEHIPQNDNKAQKHKNLLFYQDKLLSSPSPGYSIETFLRHKEDHWFFDEYPGFMQWLFPTREQSNWNKDSYPLDDEEIKAIREDQVLSKRFLNAYRTGLYYFGMELEDDIQGKIRAVPETFEQRWFLLNQNPDCYRRLTRILMSIGEMGFERFQVQLIEFLINEGVHNGKLPSLGGEDIQHWLRVITDESERITMFKKYQSLANRTPCYECDTESSPIVKHTKRQMFVEGADPMQQKKKDKLQINKFEQAKETDNDKRFEDDLDFV